MDLMALLRMFGSEAPVVLALLGLFGAGVVVVALRQGRPISLWPPSLGAPAATKPAKAIWSSDARNRPSDKAPVDREYGVTQARDFYQKIARNYDLRSTGNLGLTQLAALAQIQEIRSQRSRLRVLDPGLRGPD